MDGKTFAAIIERELLNRHMSKGDFYDAVGVTAAAMWGWKNGATPKESTVIAVEKCLGIDLSDYEKSAVVDDEDAEILQWIREDFSHRALFKSARGLTAEQTYAAASFVEKLKSGDT